MIPAWLKFVLLDHFKLDHERAVWKSRRAVDQVDASAASDGRIGMVKRVAGGGDVGPARAQCVTTTSPHSCAHNATVGILLPLQSRCLPPTHTLCRPVSLDRNRNGSPCTVRITLRSQS